MTSNSLTLDQDLVQQMIEQAVQNQIQSTVEQLGQDPVWIDRVERLITQTITQRAVASLKSVDLTPVVRECVEERMDLFRQDMITQFASTGIQDLATKCQLTIMDDTTVVENRLTAQDIETVGTVSTQDLVVKGSINVNNHSWQTLSEDISQKTLDKIDEQWRNSLVDQVKTTITQDGIDFKNVNIDGEPLIDGSKLNYKITQSRLISVGTLENLSVSGEATINQTVNVKRGRLGVNTESPEMALSIWDEEVSVVIGKHKAKQAYIGTNRDQAVAIGVNRVPHVEIDTDGLTTIKQLRVGVHRISHATQVPGWAGTRGDLVFNSNPTDRVFAWVCLGAHKWQTLKSAE